MSEMDRPRETLEMAEGVHWVGVKDWDRRMFDRLIPLPQGTSYNAYLIQGEEKNALIDSVNPGFEESLEAKIRKHLDPTQLDYLVMNHAEPDHANGFSHILSLAPKARLLASEKGGEMATSLYSISEGRIETVEDGERLDLGGKTLRFIDAPWLHWPETTLTFYEEEGILFPCDFFGAHVATGKFYADQLGEIALDYAKSYFGEIMMPYRQRAKRAMDKLQELEIETVAPSHGVIYRNPEKILRAYRSWTEGELARKVLVPYISMWGSTEEMVEVLVETMASEGVEVVPFNLATGSLGDLARELVDAGGIVIGTPTVLAGPHPNVHHIVYLAKKLNPPARYLGVVESHGWAGGAIREIAQLTEGMEGEIVDTVSALGSPSKEDLKKVIDFGKEFAAKINSI